MITMALLSWRNNPQNMMTQLSKPALTSIQKSKRTILTTYQTDVD